MGGIAGHMMHLYENPELTFKDIKDIFTQASSGRLEGTEKTDGQNLFISYSVKDGKAKAARNKGNIKQGGLDAVELAKKFEDRGSLTLSFVESFRAFEKAIAALDRNLQSAIFGPDADIFYNAEIMDPRSANVIQYDKKTLTIHQVGHAFFDRESGEVQDIDVAKNVNILNKVVSNMQTATKGEEYTVQMNALRTLEASRDNTALKTALGRLARATDAVGISDNQTIGEYLVARLQPHIEEKAPTLSQEAKALLMKRLLGTKGVTFNQVAALAPKEKRQEIREIIRNQKTLLKEAIFPIESIVHDFSVEMLRNLQSAFVLNNAKEVKRLRSEVAQAIAAIEQSGNEEALAILQKQMEKLKDVENIGTASEGFVFSYKGQTYKFTGNFAPMNQLLGLFKYGRGNVPAMIKEGDTDGQTVAVIPGAFKPPHKGHLEMVRSYAEVSDRVIVFMSPLARKLPDDSELTFDIAKSIWMTYLKSEDLLNKVTVLESPVNSPVAATFQFVANEEDNPAWAQAGETVILGVSTKGGDQSRFSGKAQKYAKEGVTVLGGDETAVAPTITAAGQELSASDMREAIADGDLEAFAGFIPDKLRHASEKILTNIKKRLSIKQPVTEMMQNMVARILKEEIGKNNRKLRSCMVEKRND